METYYGFVLLDYIGRAIISLAGDTTLIGLHDSAVHIASS